MTTNTMMTLICDEDGHWYLCPLERRAEAEKYFKDLYDLFHEGDFDIDPPGLPEYVTEIDGPHKLVFDNPREV